MKYSLHKLEISPRSFTAGTPVRSAEPKKLLYWTTSGWEIRRTAKYDYLTVRHVGTGAGTYYLVESVFRFPCGATDELSESVLSDLCVDVTDRYPPFTEACNRASLAQVDYMGEYVHL